MPTQGLEKEKLLPVVILAGGLASRLMPLTDNLPKSLLPCLDEPFLYHQLHLLQRQGIEQIYLCLGRHSQQIKQCVRQWHTLTMDIYFCDEGEQPIGTASAIRAAWHDLPNVFFLMYGDSYLLCDFYSVQCAFAGQDKPALMTVYHNHNEGDTSNVIYKNKQSTFTLL